MLTIWGRANSINVQKVLWCCGELDLPFRRIDAGREFGRTDTPEYRQLNPNGLVPTIEDGGFVLWESNVILRYLAVKHHADAVFPPDIRMRFAVERWMDWHATTLWPALRPVFLTLVRTPPDQRDPGLLGRAQEDTERAFLILEQELSGRPFVAGERFTIADIPIGIAAHRWFALEVARPSLPSLERWYGMVRDRPAFREHVGRPLS
jgi:glutathione S-transferase